MSELLTPERHLWVVESSGAPRSGKGTITSYLGTRFRGAKTDETGADYRAITLGLMSDGKLDPDMPDRTIKGRLKRLSEHALSEYAAQRYALIATHGASALYTKEINAMVARVSPYPHVRKAVKEGFKKRVQGVMEDGTTNLLVVDGRNLSPVIKTIPGAQFLLRMFIDCSVPVAVIREAAREKIDLEDPASNDWFLGTFRDIEERRKKDEEREEDPALPDADSLTYWFNNKGLKDTIMEEALRSKLSLGAAAMRVTAPEATHVGGRTGIGRTAFRTGRQVYLDTSDISLMPMLSIAEGLVREAFEEADAVHAV